MEMFYIKYISKLVWEMLCIMTSEMYIIGNSAINAIWNKSLK